MTVEKFINYTKRHPLKWINYCEILIDSDGSVILARPSHQEALIKYCMKKYSMTREDYLDTVPMWCGNSYIVEKENLICVWYRELLLPKKILELNNFQLHTIEKLEETGLIMPRNSRQDSVANDYSCYLYRKSLGIED